MRADVFSELSEAFCIAGPLMSDSEVIHLRFSIRLYNCYYYLLRDFCIVLTYDRFAKVLFLLKKLPFSANTGPIAFKI